MKATSDVLTVSFDSSLDDEAGICVSRVVNGKYVVLKQETGEQGDILYHLLTEQMTKAELKVESDNEMTKDVGELSDGYHTFNQLYHQRAVLFACIVRQNKNKAWKSFKHSDGKYCFDSNGEWFIVGVDTPQGSYTYHYAKEYWDMFDCQELERGKEWDGHTEEDVNRLLSLEQQTCEDYISREALLNSLEEPRNWTDSEAEIQEQRDYENFVALVKSMPSVTSSSLTGYWIPIKSKKGSTVAWRCSNCGNSPKHAIKSDFCPNCGAKMEVEK